MNALEQFTSRQWCCSIRRKAMAGCTTRNSNRRCRYGSRFQDGSQWSPSPYFLTLHCPLPRCTSGDAATVMAGHLRFDYTSSPHHPVSHITQMTCSGGNHVTSSLSTPRVPHEKWSLMPEVTWVSLAVDHPAWVKPGQRLDNKLVGPRTGTTQGSCCWTPDPLKVCEMCVTWGNVL